jgi:deoxyribodipyrimidine photo-lyase
MSKCADPRISVPSNFFHPPTRSEALDRVARFASRAGAAYASGRNTDVGPDEAGHVSRLSPYVRRRLVTEAEVVAHVLTQHSPQACEKFVQEVLWRTYWKGWLEMRRGVWRRFLDERDRQRDALEGLAALRDAESGNTGIEGFDDWARELVRTGYLHNHARMWFASIWIFTLRLPWALGADFFLRHLLDADPASNTLSWRWVAGLQTPGKTYLATTDNISRYTEGRFAPRGLVGQAIALVEPPPEAPRPLPPAARVDRYKGSVLLVTDEDMSPETIFAGKCGFAGAVIAVDAGLLWGEKAREFATSAGEDASRRIGAAFGCPVALSKVLDAETLISAAESAGVRHIVTAYAPVGPVADRLDALARELADVGITLTQARRDWDETFWPYAKKGFFAFKEQIPVSLREMGLM